MDSVVSAASTTGRPGDRQPARWAAPAASERRCTAPVPGRRNPAISRHRHRMRAARGRGSADVRPPEHRHHHHHHHPQLAPSPPHPPPARDLLAPARPALLRCHSRNLALLTMGRPSTTLARRRLLDKISPVLESIIERNNALARTTLSGPVCHDPLTLDDFVAYMDPISSAGYGALTQWVEVCACPCPASVPRRARRHSSG